MRVLFLCLFMAFCAIEANSYPRNVIEKPKVKRFEVVATIFCRVTYYTPHEPGYQYGTKVAWQEVKRAKQGKTCAIDPDKIPYGTKLYIPELHGVLDDGLFQAEDCGSAVSGLKAIPKKLRKKINHVVDIFVDSNKTMRRLERTMPRYMEVHILKEA